MLSKKPSIYRYFVEFAFNGGKYHGWQIQPNAITVQEVLNRSFSTLLNRDINLVGAGRTDSGVHASHFIAQFDMEDEINGLDNLVYKMNGFLESDIRIDRIEQVSSDLHARFNALSRTYNYLISTDKAPFLNEFSWAISRPLDCNKMNEASDLLMKYTDFTSFAKLHADTKTNICSIKEANWSSQGDYLVFRIKADRFLRNMVRAIVGTLIELGTGKIDIDEFQKIIEMKDRSSAGQSAPPQGLFLTHIEYPKDEYLSITKSPFERFF